MKIRGNTAGTTMPRSDWNQQDPAMADFILGKETVEEAIRQARETAVSAASAAETAQATADAARTAAGNNQAVAGEALALARGSQAQHRSIRVTLSAGGWANGRQRLAVEKLKADDTVISTPAPESMQLYVDAGVRLLEQGENTLLYSCEEVPAGDLTLGLTLLAAVTPPPEAPAGITDWNAPAGESGHVLNRTHWVETAQDGSEIVHKLPEKFLPEGVATKEYVAQLLEVIENGTY